jgi:hypothetical protein
MSRNLESSRMHHESVINDRNQQALTIGLATIVIIRMVGIRVESDRRALASSSRSPYANSDDPQVIKH